MPAGGNKHLGAALQRAQRQTNRANATPAPGHGNIAGPPAPKPHQAPRFTPAQAQSHPHYVRQVQRNFVRKQYSDAQRIAKHLAGKIQRGHDITQADLSGVHPELRPAVGRSLLHVTARIPNTAPSPVLHQYSPHLFRLAHRAAGATGQLEAERSKIQAGLEHRSPLGQAAGDLGGDDAIRAAMHYANTISRAAQGKIRLKDIPKGLESDFKAYAPLALDVAPVPGGKLAGRFIKGALRYGKATREVAQAVKPLLTKEGRQAAKLRGYGIGEGQVKLAQQLERERIAKLPVARRAAAKTLPKLAKAGRYGVRGTALASATPLIVGASTGNLNKELSGEGSVAKAFSTAANTAKHIAPEGIARNIISDAIELPSQAIPSVYIPAKALAHGAATGDWSQWHKLKDQFEKTDPLYAVSQGQWDAALQRAKAHPLFTALEVAGAKAAAGRGVGAARHVPFLRRTGVGRAANEARTPLHFPGVERGGERQVLATREYSADAIKSARQHVQEALLRKAKFDPNEAIHRQELRKLSFGKKLAHKAGGGKIVEEVLAPSRSWTKGLLAKSGGTVDSLESAYSGLRRQHQHELQTLAKEFKIGRGEELIPLAVSEYARPGHLHTPEQLRSDLLHYGQQLENELKDPRIPKDQIAFTKATMEHVRNEAVKGFSKAESDKIYGAAERYKELHSRQEKELIAQGHLHPEQAQRAALVAAGVTHLKHLGFAHDEGVGFSIDHPSTRTLHRGEGAGGGGTGDYFPGTKWHYDTKEAAQSYGPNIKTSRVTVKHPLDLEGPLNPDLSVAVQREAGYPNSLKNLDRLASTDRTTNRQFLEAANIALDSKRATDVVGKAGFDAIDVRGPKGTATALIPGKVPELANAPARVQLSTEDLAALLKNKHGIENPGFLSTVPLAHSVADLLGPSKRRPYTQRPGMSSAKLTGEASRYGSRVLGVERLGAQLQKSQSLIDATNALEGITSELGLKKADGSYFEFKDAEAFAAAHPEKDLVPLRIAPTAGDALASAQERIDAGGLIAHDAHSADQATLGTRILDAAQKPGPGNTVLVPREALNRLVEHHEIQGRGTQLNRVVSTGFKNVVLPTSPKWLFGNFFDTNMRALLSGVTPFVPGRNTVLAKKFVRQVEERATQRALDQGKSQAEAAAYGKDQAHLFMEHTVTGSHFASVERNVGEYADFARTSAQDVVAKPFEFYGKYARAVRWGNTHFIENIPQWNALGKIIRNEIRKNTGKWEDSLVVQEKALKELADGVLNGPKQREFADKMQEIFGNWTRNSPGTKNFLLNYAPFWMWARAATRFVLITMPRDHPVQTGLLAAATAMTERERQQLGLTLLKRDQVPGSVQGGVPTGKGNAITPFARVSSFGFFADYPDALSGMVLPQFNSLLSGAKDISPYQGELKRADGTPTTIGDRIKYGLAAFGEAFIPFASLSKTIREGGRSPAPLSTFADIQTFPPKKGHKAKKPDYLEGLRRGLGVSNIGPVPVIGIPRELSSKTVKNLRKKNTEKLLPIPAKPKKKSDSGGWSF